MHERPSRSCRKCVPQALLQSPPCQAPTRTSSANDNEPAHPCCKASAGAENVQERRLKSAPVLRKWKDLQLLCPRARAALMWDVHVVAESTTATTPATATATESVEWRERKDPNNFISWVPPCQAHREEIARKRGATSAEGQGVPGRLKSWLGGLELAEDENIACFTLTTKHKIQSELTLAQGQSSQLSLGATRRARTVEQKT